MKPIPTAAARLCRPQRLGLFGRRGVGKTTFLTMLYREAVGGRLPGLRLAAADARTAEYLSDKVLQLEAGRPLPATLAETPLRFHLYHDGRRIDLLVKDYQGEHVALGREEPIREFLRDCDAVWLCLDAALTDASGTLLRAEQEVEQVVEDYLSAQPAGEAHRPTALIVTKSDLLSPDSANAAAGRFGMTKHALTTHAVGHALYAVSSLGDSLPPADPASDQPTIFLPKPEGLAGPLTWLAAALQAQDEARLEELWKRAGNHVSLLRRCMDCFARRYPDAPATAMYRRKLRDLTRRRFRRRLLIGSAAVVGLALALFGYDAWGLRQTRQFEDGNADLAAVVQDWRSYQTWHPTRNLFRPAAVRDEEAHLRDLDERQRQRLRAEQGAERLTEVRQRAADADADPEAVWGLYRSFREDFPERNVEDDLEQFRTALKARRDAERERRAQESFADLESAEEKAELPDLVARADRFLHDFGDTSLRDKATKRRHAYLVRIDLRDFESVRGYSAREPLNFYTRRENYQRYLDRHPQGAFAAEARDGLKAVAADWDKADFREVRDHYQEKPADVKELAVLSRSYLAAHPDGRFTDAARDLLRWTERVGAEHEYHVVLRKGHFGAKTAGWFSGGPAVSVEVEVNGVRSAPSWFIKHSYDPEWNFEFPRPIRWKMGDPVTVRATDHYYWQRQVFEIKSGGDDPLALKLLSGEVSSGDNTLTFESDFDMPVMPRIE